MAAEAARWRRCAPCARRAACRWATSTCRRRVSSHEGPHDAQGACATPAVGARPAGLRRPVAAAGHRPAGRWPTWWLDPNPPKRVTLATGPAAKRLRRIRQALPEGAEGLRHRGGAGAQRGLAENLRCCARARRTWASCRAAATTAMPTRKAASSRWAACSSSRCGCSTARTRPRRSARRRPHSLTSCRTCASTSARGSGSPWLMRGCSRPTTSTRPR
jgi:hypothetical protein